MTSLTPIIAVVLATIATLAVCLEARRIGEALRVMDAPDAVRKRHAQVTPLVGGLAVVLPIIALSLFYGRETNLPIFNAYAAVMGGALLLGFRDDRKHLPATLRLVVSAGIALVAILMFSPFQVQFLRFSFLDLPIFTNGWGLPFTILCLVGLQNAVNMADGKNGLVIGLTFIWTLLLSIYAPPHLLPLLAALMAGLAVAFVFNMRGRLFLGDAGAYALSFSVALTALYIYNVNFVDVPADMVALWFLLPVTDCLRLMITRALSGRSPFSADRQHLHHILLRFMAWDRALVIYLSLVAIPSFLAVWMPNLTLLWGLLSLSAYATVIASAKLLQLDHEVGARSS
jgi:UDP-GlcNAc:undecaprenyl-phosphate GlcNAc-1-phosphate transferase